MMYFNENMTYIEALRALYKAVEGKPKEEVEAIKEEYKKIIPVITKKELSGPYEMTSYQLG